jgi:outer membrane protein assembly factor BamB
MKYHRLLALFCLSIFVCTSLLYVRFAAHAAHSTAQISLDPTYGPPTSIIKVQGTGFAPDEAVSLTFGSTQVGTAITNNVGTFSATFKVPASARPGSAQVTATQQNSGLSASARFLVRTDWSTFGFDNHRSFFNPYENTLSPSTVPSLVLDWMANTGNTTSTSSPAVANGMVYIGSNDEYLHAFNATTGEQIWSYSIGPNSEASPAVANGIVYMGSDSHILYALNAETGALIWSVTLGSVIYSAPAVSHGILYVGSDKLYALNAATGQTVWTFAGNGFIYSSPAIVNGVVYIGDGDHNVYALNTKSGTLLWTASTGGVIESSPDVANGVVYIGSDDGDLYAFSATTGAALWKVLVGHGYPVSDPPAVAHGVVYIGAFNVGVFAYDASTGATLWSSSCGEGRVSVANRVVYSIGYRTVYALTTKKGGLLWSYTLGGSAYGASAIANGILYIGATDGNLYAFHLAGS